MLTIIVPVYNTEKYLSRCFDGLVNKDVKVIIVNDGSNDNSQNVIDHYCNQFENFKCVSIQNSGPSKARMVGLSLVDTKYFAFVDSDDYVSINGYINLCKKMNDSNIRIGVSRINLFLINGKFKLQSKLHIPGIVDYSINKKRLTSDISILCNKIYHTDLRRYFETNNLKAYEDAALSYAILAINQKAIQTNEAFYYYCMREDSTFFSTMKTKDSSSIKTLYESCKKRRELFLKYDLLEYYSDELDAIDIQLFFLRIKNIYKLKTKIDKNLLAGIVLDILRKLVPEFENNKYYRQYFIHSELNDFHNYLPLSQQLVYVIHSLPYNHDFQ